MDVVSIIAIITSVSSLAVIFGKTIKKSTCCACLSCESRTPPPSIVIDSQPQSSPQINRKNNFINEISV
jgi:hypothetical protein